MARDITLPRPSGAEALSWLGGMALGAALMYFADPQLGARRRARIGDALSRIANRLHGARLATPSEGIVVERTIHIQAPVEAVFRYGTPRHFAAWMSHVREVIPGPRGALHWVIEGPAGMPVRWDAREVKRDENRLVAWRSLPGAMVDAAGRITFEPENGGTRMHLQLQYVPFGGLVGQAVARAMGDDPMRPLDEDLARFRTLLEAGMPAGDAEWPSGPEPPGLPIL